MFARRQVSSTPRGVRTISSALKQAVRDEIPARLEVLKQLKATHSDRKLGDVTVANVIGGMRGLKALLWQASDLDANEGIRFHGKTITECQQMLPKAEGANGQMLPESMLWFLLTGKAPTAEQVAQLSRDLAENGDLPDYAVALLDSLPRDMHPMTQFGIAVAALNRDSQFAKAYQRGIRKNEYWEYTFDDALTLIAKLPQIAAKIYQHTYTESSELVNGIDVTKDLSYNYARMIGFEDKAGFIDAFRLYTALHGDHEGGNVSAHTTHLVGSALSDPYLSYSAGLLGLAGPLHGLAAQEALRFVLNMKRSLPEGYGDEDIRKFLNDTLASGQVIPGYGHAVLRKPDPRFDALMEFAAADESISQDPVWQLVRRTSQIAPDVLTKHGKAKNPFPNVDSSSGVLFHHFGIKHTDYYTVTFGVSRALGPLTQLIWDRIYGLPIERPKSVTIDFLQKL